MTEDLKPETNHTKNLEDKINEFLKSTIGPALASHGGGVTMTKFEEGNVYLRLEGGCQGCAHARQTLRNGIEVELRKNFPQIKEVFDDTDHSQGQNPFN